MHFYAQTNIQFFNQLCRDSYSNTELGYILNAYKLVICLFTGRFRRSGKTFIAHLLGTASILSSLHAPAKVVAAGLVHAAYDNGDFGNKEKGISDIKREQVRCAVGQEVEEYVARYTALQWNEQTIPAIRDGLETLDLIDRDVLLIRLANELEKHLDLGLLYFSHQQYINHNSHLMVQIAEQLGFPTLAIELARAHRATSSAEIPVEFRGFLLPHRLALTSPNLSPKQMLVALYYLLLSRFRHLRFATISTVYALLNLGKRATRGCRD